MTPRAMTTQLSSLAKERSCHLTTPRWRTKPCGYQHCASLRAGNRCRGFLWLLQTWLEQHLSHARQSSVVLVVVVVSAVRVRLTPLHGSLASGCPLVPARSIFLCVPPNMSPFFQKRYYIKSTRHGRVEHSTALLDRSCLSALSCPDVIRRAAVPTNVVRPSRSV